MDGCIYRTKDGECELWENDRNHSPFCNPDCDHKHPSNADRIRGCKAGVGCERRETHELED